MSGAREAGLRSRRQPRRCGRRVGEEPSRDGAREVLLEAVWSAPSLPLVGLLNAVHPRLDR